MANNMMTKNIFPVFNMNKNAMIFEFSGMVNCKKGTIFI